MHATIFWSAGTWWLQDLSTNGTWLDGSRLEVGRRYPLREGSELCIAATHRLRLVDASPPVATATTSSGDRCEAHRGVLTLPPGDSPVASIYRQGGRRWVVERDGEVQDLADDDALVLGEVTWQLHLPEGMPTSTVRPSDVGAQPPSLRLAELQLSFEVRGPEVIVRLLPASDATPPLQLQPRSYHHTLLILARERLQDPNGGWLHLFDLAERVAPSSDDPQRVRSRIEVHVHRARRQLAALGVWGAEQLVERRQGHGELRLGTDRITIVE